VHHRTLTVQHNPPLVHHLQQYKHALLPAHWVIFTSVPTTLFQNNFNTDIIRTPQQMKYSGLNNNHRIVILRYLLRRLWGRR